ncbi:uncharacterized protein LOC105426618 isoform X2 [Pogonomyrmex barbatus]|nr:uncharacterized protein LOC105426618 isoform X2 [Pogonomyrmex barbatus]XP_011636220.1 uncharacterized protein LOC105426618 isoform X2 [Pogonomyrmex barbatus]
MITNNIKRIDVMRSKIAKAEQDDVLEDNPRSKKMFKEKSCSKRNAPRVFTEQLMSIRIKELAQPTKQRALNTLKEKGMILPPMFVDNLTRIVRARSYLTPEEAAQIRRDERGMRKARRRLPQPLAKKPGEIAKEIARAPILDRDATMCQYLMAELFVRSILGYRRETQKRHVREIADVIMRRLTSLVERGDVKNGDRATQQLQLLADTVATWMDEVLVEVADMREKTLEEYSETRQMKTMDVDDDNETNEKIEDRDDEVKGKQAGEELEMKNLNNMIQV